MPQSHLDNPTKVHLQEPEDGTEPDIIIGSREQLFHLLAEASEIEHTLMCTYLYAAFSLKGKNGAGLSEEESASVERWREMIMGVAIEEMGHLMIVANLTAAIGGRPHFARPNFPVVPGHFPSGVALRLAPFSFDTLDHFIFLERPTGIELEDAGGSPGESLRREQAHRRLMPSAQDYVTVSHLYEAIRANLKAFAERSGASALFIGPESGQIGAEMIRMHGVEVIRDLDSANRAIDLIVEQGEGSSAARDDSHFKRFQDVKAEYSSFLEHNAAFAPAFPVAENPIMRRRAGLDDTVFIDAEPAATVLDLANAVYGMLLRFLVQAYTKGSLATALAKQELLTGAIELMHVLDHTSKLLATLPASASHPHLNAGMTFTMLRGVEPFIGGAAENLLISERLVQLASGAQEAAVFLPAISQSAQRLSDLAARFRT